MATEKAQYRVVGQLKTGKAQDGRSEQQFISLTNKDVIIEALEKARKDANKFKAVNLYFEDPRIKYDRMLKSGKLDDKAVEEITEKLAKIPEFVVADIKLKVE